MKTEQFNQLQTICTLDGLCYSLNMVFEELVDCELPEEIENAAEDLQMRLRSFRATVEAYVIYHKDDYIDKEEESI